MPEGYFTVADTEISLYVSVCVHPATTISSGWGYDTEAHALKKKLEDALGDKILVREIKDPGITGKNHSQVEFMHYIFVWIGFRFQNFVPVGSPLSIKSYAYIN